MGKSFTNFESSYTLWRQYNGARNLPKSCITRFFPLTLDSEFKNLVLQDFFLYHWIQNLILYHLATTYRGLGEFEGSGRDRDFCGMRGLNVATAIAR